jgi:hypothetical protein
VTMRLQTWRFLRAALTTRTNSVECCGKDTSGGSTAYGIRAMELGFYVGETAVAVIDDASVTRAFRKASYSIDEVGNSCSRVLARDFRRRGWRGACFVRAIRRTWWPQRGRRARMPSEVRSVTGVTGGGWSIPACLGVSRTTSVPARAYSASRDDSYRRALLRSRAADTKLRRRASGPI